VVSFAKDAAHIRQINVNSSEKQEYTIKLD